MTKIVNYDIKYNDNGIKKFFIYSTRFSLFDIMKGTIKDNIFIPSDVGDKYMIFYNWIVKKFFCIIMNHKTGFDEVFGKNSWAIIPDSKKKKNFIVNFLNKNNMKEIFEERRQIYKIYNMNNNKDFSNMITDISYINFLNKILIDTDTDKEDINYKKMINVYKKLKKINTHYFKWGELPPDDNINKIGWSKIN